MKTTKLYAVEWREHGRWVRGRADCKTVQQAQFHAGVIGAGTCTHRIVEVTTKRSERVVQTPASTTSGSLPLR
jgi:hypothetical protein